MLQIMIANIINMVIGIGNSFLLPKFLSVNSYAMIKTYALYITYASVFCFGYNEGMYLKYGGIGINKINKNDLNKNFFNFFFLEILTTIIIFIIGIILDNYIIKAFAFGKFTFNIMGYMKSLYQATGEFALYGIALNVEKIGIFLFNLILLFILKSDNYYFYIDLQVIVGLFVTVYLFLVLQNKLHFFKFIKISFSEIRDNISNGFILMLGNFSSSIFTGLDRWFVKILMTSVNFAYYSFAVSIQSLINVFITPITVSMYNYFCKGIEDEYVQKIKNYVVIWGFAIISIGFPLKWIVIKFLEKYIPSMEVFFILLAAQPFYAVIKGIYVNIYKAEKKQNKYLVQMLVMTCIGCLLNMIFYYILHSMEAIAYATLITSIIWLIICEIDSKKFRFKINEIISILIVLLTYIIATYFLSALVGFVIYIIIALITAFIFMRSSICEIIKYMKEFINNKKFYKK
ncbi:MAG: hypothetical protein ACLVKE_01600 [Clostridium baratii]